MSEPHEPSTHPTWGLVPPTRLVALRATSHPEGEDQQRSTHRPHLRPVAAWRMDCSRFGFDSSFVGPHARHELPDLAALRSRLPNHPISIFGHCDPSGEDEYNKRLSGRRALALYGLLVRNVEIWEWIYTSPTPGDDWGARTLQTILATLPADDGAPYYTGSIDGDFGSGSRAALERFQQSHVDSQGKPLAVDGKAGTKTRKALFGAYMDHVCVDGEGEPYSLTDDDFLARGADPQHRGDVQGCSELNPLMVFSAAEHKAFAKPSQHEARDEQNSINRRAVVFVYPPGIVVDPKAWPCPAARDGSLAACKKRLWSDGSDRRKPQEQRRFFDGDENTFACRFYHYQGLNTPADTPVHLRPTFDLYVDGGDPLTGTFILATDDGTWEQSTNARDALTLRTASGHPVSCASFVGLPPGQTFTLSYRGDGGDPQPVVLMSSFRVRDFAQIALGDAEGMPARGTAGELMFPATHDPVPDDEPGHDSRPAVAPGDHVVDVADWDGDPIVFTEPADWGTDDA